MRSAAASRPDTTPRVLDVRWLGRLGYADGLDLQARTVIDRRHGRVADQLLLLEHPHVITLGTSAHADNVLLDEHERTLLGIEMFETGRGGDVTYHGPGQLIGYPILHLEPDRHDLHRYVRDLEEVLIRSIAELGLEGRRSPGKTGVWVGDEKLAAIGVRVSSGWITSHGFALNIDTDLRYFDAIVPCGLRGLGVTSIARLTGAAPSFETMCMLVARHFADVFERTHAETSANTSRRT